MDFHGESRVYWYCHPLSKSLTLPTLSDFTDYFLCTWIAILSPSVPTWAEPVWNKGATIKDYALFPDLMPNWTWIWSLSLPSVIYRSTFVFLWENKSSDREPWSCHHWTVPFDPLLPDHFWRVADKFLLMTTQLPTFAPFLLASASLVCFLLQYWVRPSALQGVLYTPNPIFYVETQSINSAVILFSSAIPYIISMPM